MAAAMGQFFVDCSVSHTAVPASPAPSRAPKRELSAERPGEAWVSKAFVHAHESAAGSLTVLSPCSPRVEAELAKAVPGFCGEEAACEGEVAFKKGGKSCWSTLSISLEGGEETIIPFGPGNAMDAACAAALVPKGADGAVRGLLRAFIDDDSIEVAIDSDAEAKVAGVSESALRFGNRQQRGLIKQDLQELIDASDDAASLQNLSNRVKRIMLAATAPLPGKFCCASLSK